MLPQIGKTRLNTNYTQWSSDSDLSSITGTSPAPTLTPPTNPNILGTHNISITTLPHSEKIQ
ncbi:hypothetical protein H6768_06580 [Candidatus Peribacteria bacterium]|nr:hypothetical protein [Candidatus Peribacteria bacterium]